MFLPARKSSASVEFLSQKMEKWEVIDKYSFLRHYNFQIIKMKKYQKHNAESSIVKGYGKPIFLLTLHFADLQISKVIFLHNFQLYPITLSLQYL